jgi:2-haloacid dehalogenase
METEQQKPQLILFDVYETLLDMSKVESKMNDLFHSRRAYRLWIELLMQYCLLESSSGRFHPFSVISKAALTTTANILNHPITDQLNDDVLLLMKHAPMHEGTEDGLSDLNDLGYRLAALTNASFEVITDRMEATGLISYFEFVISAEQIKKYKPTRESYEAVAKKARLDPHDILVVTSRGWDLSGASSAGMRTVYIDQDGRNKYPLAPEPTMHAKNVTELANLLQDLYPEKQVASPELPG